MPQSPWRQETSKEEALRCHDACHLPGVRRQVATRGLLQCILLVQLIDVEFDWHP
jgi:hypothetical protein